MRPNPCLLKFTIISCEGSERFRALHWYDCFSTVLQPGTCYHDIVFMSGTVYLLRSRGSWNIFHQKKAVLVMWDRLKGLDPAARSTGAYPSPRVHAEPGVGRDLETWSGMCYKITAVPSQSGREAMLLWLYFWCWTDVEMMRGCLSCIWSFSKQGVSSPPPCKQQLVVALPSVLGQERIIIRHGSQLLQNHWMWKVTPK